MSIDNSYVEMRRNVCSSLRASQFQQIKYRNIPAERCVIDPNAISRSFFYPIYYVSDSRFAWGNTVCKKHRVGYSLQEALEGLHCSYRAGSTLSVSFSLGFAFALTVNHPTANACLLIESPEGYLSYPSNKKWQNERLTAVLTDLLGPPKTNAQIIGMANRVIQTIGHIENGMLVLSGSTKRVCLYERRNFLEKEVTFINKKLRDDRYCGDLSQAYHSEADSLMHMPLTETDQFEMEEFLESA